MKAPATLYVTSTVHKVSGLTVFTASDDRAHIEWHSALKGGPMFTASTPMVAYVHPDEVARLIAEAVAAARRAA